MKGRLGSLQTCTSDFVPVIRSKLEEGVNWEGGVEGGVRVSSFVYKRLIKSFALVKTRPVVVWKRSGLVMVSGGVLGNGGRKGAVRKGCPTGVTKKDFSMR